MSLLYKLGWIRQKILMVGRVGGRVKEGEGEEMTPNEERKF